MYLVYDVHEKEAEELKEYLDINFDFENYLYQLDCFTS